MLVTPFRVFLFLVAAFVAAGGTAWYTGAFDRYFMESAPRVAQGEAKPEPEQGEAKASADDGKEDRAQGSGQDDSADASQPAAPKAAAGSNAAADGTSEDAKASEAGVKPQDAAASAPSEAGDKASGESDDKVVVPGFDVVRVEPDGSMVVAGRAAPGSTVEVISGSTVLGRTKSGPAGDFAVVLEDPLDPGDYQIVLRATEPDKVVATSKETAVVSVPDSTDGEVLALVEEPGKPSRLITTPKAKQGGSTEEVAKNEGATIRTTEGKTAKSNTYDAGTADAGAAKRTAGEQASTAGKATERKDGEEKMAMGEPSSRGAGNASGGADDAAGQNAGAAATKKFETVPSSNAKAAGDAKVFIEAVEIDGKDIFVAGGGVPGQRVRVYANDILLGDALVSPGGRFLVQTTRDLPVGDYIVRTDLLSPNGSDVVARAAVPFEREPGEKLAAVAPRAGSGDSAAGAATGQDAASANEGSQKARDGVEQPAGARKGDMVLPDLHNGLAENAPLVTEAKLEPVDGAVIIRRGDTLWHISRRVYGYGVRYSTIYLANQDQIRNPDMIWPGQVFSVPEKSDKGEMADMKAIGDQAVPLPAAEPTANN